MLIHASFSSQTMDLHASQIQGFFDVPVDKYVSFLVFSSEEKAHLGYFQCE